MCLRDGYPPEKLLSLEDEKCVEMVSTAPNVAVDQYVTCPGAWVLRRVLCPGGWLVWSWLPGMSAVALIPTECWLSSTLPYRVCLL